MNLFLFLFGALLWTFIEYIFHRFVLHRKTSNYLLHDQFHHQHPTKRPTEVPFLLLGIALLCLSACGGNWFGIGFSVGVLAYVAIHFFSHSSIVPNALLYHHQYHHLVNAHKCFGVSSPLWDYVFGTHYPKKKPFSERQLAFYKGKNKRKATL
ncbi:sterol desaturase family protein [Runella zeae]|uniref:sterol desaturase family protein n=1 Tax=Runella zeae TaxID=94255 RepID=UPI0006843006|nr:sterol desaturase family protein [Runella zeae]